MAILGDTLTKIAREKAGILKASTLIRLFLICIGGQAGVSAFTVTQPTEAAQALQACAKDARVELRVVSSLPRDANTSEFPALGERNH